jgi:YggT family protein
LNDAIATIFTTFLYLLLAAVFGRVIISYFPLSPRNQFVRFLHDVTEPLLGPVRRALPRTGMFDFSPMIVLGLIYVAIIVVDQAIAR